MKVHLIIGIYHGCLESLDATCDASQVKILKDKMEKFFDDDEESEVRLGEIEIYNEVITKLL